MLGPDNGGLAVLPQLIRASTRQPPNGDGQWEVFTSRASAHILKPVSLASPVCFRHNLVARTGIEPVTSAL